MRQHDKTQHEILAIVTTWPFPLAKNTYTHVFIANGNGGVSVWPSIPNNTNIVKKSSKIHKLSLRLSSEYVIAISTFQIFRYNV